MKKSPVPQPSTARRVVAGVLLGLLLLQVLCFFFGLMVPVNLAVVLWSKSVEERLALLAPNGAAIQNVADRLPMTARVYLMDPDAMTHKNSVYYFYPRTVTITMTDACYEARYEQWDERPTTQWLVTNHHTHLLDYRQRTLSVVEPGALPDNDGHGFSCRIVRGLGHFGRRDGCILRART